MADGSKPPKGQVTEELIIVRRIQPDDAGAKGGAWKIAYADFVTAMMAFFLVMWLINAANEKTKAQVASYFNPVKLVDNTTSTKGIKTPGDQTANSSGQKGGDALPAQEASEEKPEEENSEAKPAEEKKSEAKPPVNKQEPEGESASAVAAEALLFEDPFKLLSQIARDKSGGQDGRSDNALVIQDSNPPGSEAGQLTRDPFDPLAWKSIPQPAEAQAEPSQPEPQPEPEQPAAPETEKKSEAEPVVKTAADAGKPHSAVTEASIKQAETIRASLTNELSALGSKHPDLEVKSTREGILISLTDSISFDMFDVGSAKPRPVVVKLMEKVAAAVKQFDGKLVVRGHTDARRYRGNGYDNWRLSTARAQMAYYMLIRAGVDENAVERIEGYADKALLRVNEPQSAENRRIEILLKVAEP